MQHDDAPWEPFSPGEVAERFHGLDIPWAVVGGWAIDLFLGETTRDHEDIEIAIPRGRFGEIAERLRLEFYVPVREGHLAPLGRRPLRSIASHQTWGLDRDVRAWRIDVLREPSAEGDWVCRRDHGVRLPYSELIEFSADGIPYVRPEVALLFKAKAAREKDERDLERVLPRLSPERRALLGDWVGRVHPGHAWLQRLSIGTKSRSPGPT